MKIWLLMTWNNLLWWSTSLYVINEGLGSDKCCYSIAIDNGVWKRRKLAFLNGDKNLLGSSPTIIVHATIYKVLIVPISICTKENE